MLSSKIIMINLIIYNFDQLYEILNEIKKELNINILNCERSQLNNLNFNQNDNYIIVSKNKIQNIKNQLLIDKFPIEVNKLVEKLNIHFLKNKFNQQTDISVGTFRTNLNSRKIYDDSNELDLTEKETKIIIFLNNSKNPVSIIKLQDEVWGYKNKLETHTVETHIYRLRKKISDKFNISNYIKSNKFGYFIN